jgi:hypothetical protein
LYKFFILEFKKKYIYIVLKIIDDGKKHGPAGANLFIFHLPTDYKDSDLERLFS